ncbi:GNAT family N-acetyltransferase [Candidatus Woesearchaeota archaeon]|nr:GNAT family N-acetyltransferase [Candidatus Woesearchaeota archaeon]
MTTGSDTPLLIPDTTVLAGPDHAPVTEAIVLPRQLSLRPVEPADAPLLARWFNDYENIKWMSTFVRCRKHTTEELRQDIVSSDPSSERLFMVYDEWGIEPIGHAGIDGIDQHDRRAEIFFLIGDRANQGKGYGRMILRLLIEQAFDAMGLNSLFATAAVENHASVRLLESGGFRRIGIRREFNLVDGAFVDEVFLDMTRKDYQAMKDGAAGIAGVPAGGTQMQ